MTLPDELLSFHFFMLKTHNDARRRKRFECAIKHQGHYYRASRFTIEAAALAAIRKCRAAQLRVVGGTRKAAKRRAK